MRTDVAPPVNVVLGRFRLGGEPLRGSPQRLAAQWRGAVASVFHADSAFHGHAGDRTIARYPEVQYRWVDEAPVLFALGPAAQRVLAHPWPHAPVRFGDQERSVLQVEWSVSTLGRAFSRRLVRYDLGAPWIALNQQNHTQYGAMRRAERRAELDRILVGNLLTMSKAFGWFYDATETVYAAFDPEREVSCVVKDVHLLGFQGSFVTNLDLPDDLAIGRSVSHGFGWFRRAGGEWA